MAAQRRGRRGEEFVAVWYERHGYDVLARNWRCELGEIDLVCAMRRTIVFCEVKSRSSTRFGAPIEVVGPVKQQRLRRLATAFLAERRSIAGAAGRTGRGAAIVRFDVASVLGEVVEVVESAF